MSFMKKSALLTAATCLSFLLAVPSNASSLAAGNRDLTIDTHEVEQVVDQWLYDTEHDLSITDYLDEHYYSAGSDIRPQVFSGIVKKAIIYALRHHADKLVSKLPKKMRGPVSKYAKRIANLLDRYDSYKEDVFRKALKGIGVPKKPAGLIAKALAILIG